MLELSELTKNEKKVGVSGAAAAVLLLAPAAGVVCMAGPAAGRAAEQTEFNCVVLGFEFGSPKS